MTGVFVCAICPGQGPIHWHCRACGRVNRMGAVECGGCVRDFGWRPVVVLPTAACAECGDEFRTRLAGPALLRPTHDSEGIVTEETTTETRDPRPEALEAFIRAFAEWMRRYNEEPGRFAAEFGDPDSYGEGAARYFVRLLEETS